MNQQELDEVNVVVVGEGMCGKTTMIRAFVDREFTPQLPPTLFDHYRRNVTVSGKEKQLEIWDVGGQYDHANFRDLAYAKADVFLMCFDFNNPQSLTNIETFWIKEIQDCKNRDKLAAMVLVGCKSDLRAESAITQAMIDKTKDSKSCFFSTFNDCSAKQMDGVDDVFFSAAQFGCAPWKQPFNKLLDRDRSSQPKDVIVLDPKDKKK